MRILAFSDLHRDVEAARRIVEASARADVVVGAGDFATCGEGAKDTVNILRGIDVPVVFVFGNHDRPDELRTLCRDWDSGYLLHGDMVELQGLAFFGVGGEIPGRNTEPWNAALTEDEAHRILQDCPKDVVLITHTPPYECADVQRDGTHEGSRAVRAMIDDKQPLLSLCGHIHFAWGSFGTLGRTRVHNLGPGVSWFNI
jgi:uncharacterized protein